MSAYKVVKDPGFPMKHTQITDLKNKTKQVTDEVAEADVMVIRNGETVCYMVNPAHYEAMVAAVMEAGVKATETFLKNYQERNGSLTRLDASYNAAQRGEFASADQVAQVFGSR